MDSLELMKDIIATYERHGWKLRRVLARPENVSLVSEARDLFRDAELREADFDALWFARASHAGREAWELRLVSEQPYALFELFEVDETEEAREAARREMENRMREHAKPAEA
jgi:NAD(P)H-nitrite reductase large subunit